MGAASLFEVGVEIEGVAGLGSAAAAVFEWKVAIGHAVIAAEVEREVAAGRAAVATAAGPGLGARAVAESESDPEIELA
jgi:hypothetical protein